MYMYDFNLITSFAVNQPVNVFRPRLAGTGFDRVIEQDKESLNFEVLENRCPLFYLVLKP
jgi:hypothetical protein